MTTTGPFIVTHQQTRVEHDADCFWNRAHPPVDGDEAACCSCGAYADAAVPLYREAFATLEEADQHVVSIVAECGHPTEPSTFPANNERINLPDGSVIEVEATEWRELVAALSQHVSLPAPGSVAARWPTPEQKHAIRAAWNAEHSIGHPAEPQAQSDDACSQCAASLADGEGYDGLCGPCADRAEVARDAAPTHGIGIEAGDSEVDWKDRSFGELSADEQRAVMKDASGRLERELRDNADTLAEALDDEPDGGR